MKLHPQYYGWMAVLTTAHIVINIGVFGSAGLIHLTAVKSSLNVSNVISVAVLSHFLCKRSVGKIQILAAVICISGIILIWQPWQPTAPGITTNITDRHDNTTNFNKHFHGHGEVPNTVLGYVAAIIAGVAVTVYFLTTSIPLSGVDTVTQITWVAMVGLPVSAIISVYFESPVIPTDPIEILLIFIHSISATLNTISITSGCRLIGPIITSFVTNFGGVLYLISQYTVMKDVMPGHQNWVEVVGALLTTLGVALLPAAGLFIEWWTSKGPPMI